MTARALWSLIAILTLALAGVSAILGAKIFRDPDRAREASAVLRGQRVAERIGCFGCHGPGGIRGSFDPTAPSGSVPSWSGGTLMMYVQGENEIREWILDGLPARLSRPPEAKRERLDKLTLRMPAYRGRLAESELADLVAYFKAVSWFVTPSQEAAVRGRERALELGCLGCHGSEGRGMTRNPGSLKGFIPPWDSDDWNELVASDEEFDEWVTTGEIARFRRNPAAAHFLDGQIIKMPAYRDRLKPGDLEALRAFARWVRLSAKR